MAGSRFALEQAERFRDGIYQRPIETQQLTAGSSSKHNSRHGLVRTKLVEFFTQLLKGDDVALRQLGQSKLEGSHGIRVREDLGGLLERLVLIDRNERRCRPAVPSDENVIPPVGDLAQHLTEMGTELSGGNCSGCHLASVRSCVLSV